jgi:hypothetical protein
VSHYFQQLLACSGLVRTVPALASASTVPLGSAPSTAFSEITEETVAPPAGPISDPTTAPADDSISLPPSSLDSQPSRPAAILESGVIEISTGAPSSFPSSSLKTANPAIASSPAGSPGGLPAVEPLSPPAQRSQPSDAGSKNVPSLLPSSDELIQHVFRWVGQNPADLTPPALVGRMPAVIPTTPTESSPPLAAVPPAATASTQVTRPTAESSFSPGAPRQQPGGNRELPPPRPSPAPPATISESSIEISIGMLQIQVEAPPGPAKALRRPAPPRAPRAPALAPAAQRPAIDLNRLRRGFYL